MYFVSFFHEATIRSRTVHTVVRETDQFTHLCVLHIGRDMLDYVSKRIVSIVLTPQPFLQVAFEELFRCSCTRHTSFDSPPCIFNALCVRTCVIFFSNIATRTHLAMKFVVSTSMYYCNFPADTLLTTRAGCFPCTTVCTGRDPPKFCTT